MSQFKKALPELNSFFQGVESGEKKFDDLSPYLDKCTSSFDSLGSAIDLTTVGTTFLNSALSAGIFVAANIAVSALAAMWDKMNVSLEEIQSNIDTLKTKISGLQDTRVSLILDINNSEGDKSASKNQLVNIDNQLQYEKESLEIQQKEYDKHVIGVPGTGFAKDSLQRQLEKENSWFSSDSFRTVSQVSDNILNTTNELKKRLKKAEEDLKNTEGSSSYESNLRKLNIIKSEADIYTNQASKQYGVLIEKRNQFNENLIQAQQVIDNGYLTGEDLKTAETQRDEWQSKLDEANSYLESIKKAQQETALLKFDNLSTSDLDTLDDQQLEILTTLNLDADTTHAKIMAEIGKVQDAASQEKVTIGLTIDENESIDNYKSTVETLGNALQKSRSGDLDKSDIGELVRVFPTLEGHSEDLSDAISDLIDNQLSALLEIIGEDKPPEIIDWVKQLAEVAKNADNSFSRLSDKIAGLSSLKEGMGNLGEAYHALTEDPEGLTFDNYSSLSQTFGDLDSFENFISVISNSASSIQEIQESFNGLTEEYIKQQGIMEDLNLSNADFVANQLTELGILNANEMVLAALGLTQEQYAQIKDVSNAHGINLVNITAAEIDALSKENIISSDAQQALYTYALQKALANENSLNTSADIDNLSALISALGGANSALKTYSYALSANQLSPETMEQLRQNALDEIAAARNSVYTKPPKVTSPIIDYSKEGNFLKSFKDNAKSVADTAKNTADTVKDAADEAKKALDELIKKFDELGKGHNLRLSLFTDRDDKIQDAIKLQESQGNLVGKSFYEELINSQNKQIQILTQKRSDLESFLNDSVSSGQIEVGTEQWFKMTQAVEDTKDEIMKCTTNVEDFQNKINELHWEQFDKFIDRLDGLDNEIHNIIDILGKKDLVDEDTGEWTNEGLTSLALYGEAYELAIKKAREYSDAIAKLNEAYARGEYSTLEYNEKLQELTNKQWDAVKAAQDAKDGIVALNKARVDAVKKGIEKEISATEELINKKKEALDIEKESHDFQDSVKEKQDEIYKLQRQLNGLSTDDSQEAAAKKKKIQSELTDKQKELDEIYYDESIDQQKAALDTELENYKADQENKITLLEESLTNEEELIKTSLQTVQDNHTAVYDTLTQMGDEYGIQLSAAIVNPWIESSGALAEFTTSFDEKKSHFTTELGNLGNDFEELGKKADETAKKILNMLSQIDQSYKSMDSSASEGSSSSSGSGGSSSGGSSTSSKPSPQKSKDWRRCQIVTSLGKLMGTFSSTEDAEDWLSRHNAEDGKGYHIVYYARGTRHASSGLALVNEQGTEAIFSRTPTGSFHLMNEGDQVFTKQQTDNLYRLSTAAPSLLLSAMASPALPGIGASNQQQTNSPTNIDIKCPVYIQGSVDNQNIQKIQKQIDHSILKAVGKLNQSLYKSGARRG